MQNMFLSVLHTSQCIQHGVKPAMWQSNITDGSASAAAAAAAAASTDASHYAPNESAIKREHCGGSCCCSSNSTKICTCYPVNQPSAGERRAKSAKSSSSTSARSSSGANRGSSSSSSRRQSKAAAAAVAPGAATVDDAVSYLDDVNQTYADAPDIHAEFIRILQVSNCFRQANYQSIITQCQPLCLKGFVTGFSSQSAVHFKL
jgi:histone deacetylase complex regulatory component SIN3